MRQVANQLDDIPTKPLWSLPQACAGGSIATDFVAEALRLRENASAFLQDQAARQQEALQEILAAADGLRKVGFT